MIIRYIVDGWVREVSAPSSIARERAEDIWQTARPEMLELISGSFRVISRQKGKKRSHLLGR